VAVLTDAPGGRLTVGLPVPVIVVDEPRQIMAEVAATIYGRPAEALTMYAVTGTNGKTTTTFLLEAALGAAGVRTGLIGTIGFRFDGRPVDAPRTTVTTPESTELQGLLGYLRDEGAEAVLMEVSSHALVLGRADAITFAVSAFTNLGRDHLDFHGDEESYFAAKAALLHARSDPARGDQHRRPAGPRAGRADPPHRGQPDHGQPVRAGGLPDADVRGGPGRPEHRPGRGGGAAGGVQPRTARGLQRPERPDRPGHDRRGGR
jgi:UDP-N-acetylmuramoyl-L-alanyl-D-glutamate--2,6-diaminopimelate ligase